LRTTSWIKRNREQHVLLSVVLLLALVILFSYAVSRADEASASPQRPATQLGTPRPPAPQQQPPQPPSQQAPASQEPSPTQQAIEVLRADLAGDSLNPQLHYQLANALHDAGNKEDALFEYDKVLSLKPDFKEALVNRGAVLNELGLVTNAISSFEKALALAPGDTKALVNLGNSFYALQMYDKALKQYKLAVEADTAFAEGYYYIGIAFADAGIYREAVREWERILAVAPNSETARNARENIDVLKNFISGPQPGPQPGTQ